MSAPKQSDLHRVARVLKRRLKSSKEVWITIDRWEATKLLRRVSGQRTTRIKSALGESLDRELLELGVRSFPTFRGTTTHDSIRLFRSETNLSALVDILTKPGQGTDTRLSSVNTYIEMGLRYRRGMERQQSSTS